MKITKLELTSQPSTSPKVRKQREAIVKDGVATMDAMIGDCTMLFEQAMELVMNLQEDPNPQRLNTEVRELQHQYNEVRVTTHTVSMAQLLSKL